MTDGEVTENTAVTISFSVPLWLRRKFVEQVPKRRSAYLRNLLKKEMGLERKSDVKFIARNTSAANVIISDELE